MKIAWFSPFSRKSAIGAFSAAIVKKLSKVAKVTVFASDLESEQDAWFASKPMYFLSKLDLHTIEDLLNDFDICVYNLGDNLNFHRDIFVVSSKFPGIIILHDIVMHHFFIQYFFNFLKDKTAYINSLELSHQVAGKRFGESVVNGQAGDVWMTSQMLEYNMAKFAVHGAYGVIVHSKYALETLSAYVECPIVNIPFPLFGISERVKQTNLNISTRNDVNDKVRLLTYGNINSNKMACEVVEIIGASDYLREKVIYTIVGNPAPGELVKMNNLRKKYRVEEQINIIPEWCSDQELIEHINNADIILGLRNPHFGETSSVMHESMVMGKATVVWKHGAYDEVPDDTVKKVATLVQLKTGLEELVANAENRVILGNKAREYAENQFVTQKYCSSLLAFVDSTLYNIAIFRTADFAAQKLIEQGDRPDSLATQKLIQEICILAGVK